VRESSLRSPTGEGEMQRGSLRPVRVRPVLPFSPASPASEFAQQISYTKKKGPGLRGGAPLKAGMRKQVSEMRRQRQIEQVLSREESTTREAHPCAVWRDPCGEA
jgi:hypothetical protein